MFSTNVDLDDEQIKKDIADNESDVIEKKVLDVYQSEDSDEYYILKSVCEDSNIPFSNVVVVDGLEYVLISFDNQKDKYTKNVPYSHEWLESYLLLYNIVILRKPRLRVPSVIRYHMRSQSKKYNGLNLLK